MPRVQDPNPRSAGGCQKVLFSQLLIGLLIGRGLGHCVAMAVDFVHLSHMGLGTGPTSNRNIEIVVFSTNIDGKICVRVPTLHHVIYEPLAHATVSTHGLSN